MTRASLIIAAVVPFLVPMSVNGQRFRPDHVVARVDGRDIHYYEIATLPPDPARENASLQQLVAARLAAAAARKLDVSVSESEVSAELSRLGFTSATADSIATPRRRFAEAALRVCDGEPVHDVWQQLLSADALPGSRMTEQQFAAYAQRMSRDAIVRLRAEATPDAARRSVSDAVAQRLLMRRVRQQLTQRGIAPQDFWPALIRDTGTTVLEPAFTLPSMEEMK